MQERKKSYDLPTPTQRDQLAHYGHSDPHPAGGGTLARVGKRAGLATAAHPRKRGRPCAADTSQ
jgi:hypothetical protein